jgi:hypothetical protein
MSDEAGGGESGSDISGGGTALNYALAIFYLLVATFMIILAWVIPGIVMSASVSFTILAAIIFMTAVVQIVYVSEVAATLCGKCPPPSPS